MKYIYIVLFFALLTTTNIDAQDRAVDEISAADGTTLEIPLRDNSEARTSPNARVDQTVGTMRIHVRYGRPFVKGRTIFGDLVPYGNVWRLGANEATTVTFTGDVTFGDTEVAAGTYALFAKPMKDSWEFILNSQAAQWGAYDHAPSKDIATVSVTPSSTEHTEMFTIGFTDVSATSAHLVAKWAETKVAVPISLQ